MDEQNLLSNRRQIRLMILGLFALLIIATIALLKGGKVSRCGYVQSRYGRSAVYPWRMSCADAKAVVVGSGATGARRVAFTAPSIRGDAVRIAGVWWVCVGVAGDDQCGYPYRPRRTSAGTAFTGPFSKAVVYQSCDPSRTANLCQGSAKFHQAANGAG